LRFAVEKSHKFILAGTLLIAGYAVALLLGSLSRWIVPQTADRTATAAPGGALVPMSTDEIASAREAFVALPYSATSASASASDELQAVAPPPIPVAPLNSPTWLATVPEASPIATAPTEPEAPRPIAKVTDVTPWGATAAKQAPSPWDRWPQWEPDAAANQGSSTAAFDNTVPTRTATLQASYSPSSAQFAVDSHAENAIGDGERMHIVIDGDSLAKLADQYLDDPQLGNEIYEMNRAVLKDPELLPIGVELRIPDRGMKSASRAELAPRTVGATSTESAPNRFEPADRWLERGADVPRAQLLQPVPLGRVD
jgi:hypothetical protein